MHGTKEKNVEHLMISHLVYDVKKCACVYFCHLFRAARIISPWSLEHLPGHIRVRYRTKFGLFSTFCTELRYEVESPSN